MGKNLLCFALPRENVRVRLRVQVRVESAGKKRRGKGMVRERIEREES